jgi:pyruvate/2-oxoacid:ferredoxin oxidoreductase alpha subunit
MHAVVMRFKVNDRIALQSQVDKAIAEVSATSGFVAAYWVSLERDEGIAVVVYESEHAAATAALAANVAEHSAFTAQTSETGEVIAHA